MRTHIGEEIEVALAREEPAVILKEAGCIPISFCGTHQEKLIDVLNRVNNYLSFRKSWWEEFKENLEQPKFPLRFPVGNSEAEL